MKNKNITGPGYGIGWAYRRWQKIFARINKQRIVDWVRRLKEKYPDETEEQLTHRVVKWTAQNSAATGVAMASPALLPIVGLPLSVLAVVPEEFLLIIRNCEMILKIAAIYGFDPRHEDRIYEIIIIAGNPSPVVESMITAKEDMRRIAVRVLMNVGAKPAQTAKVGTKAVSRGVIRGLPLIGLFASGGINYFTQYNVGKKAAKFYFTLNTKHNQKLLTEAHSDDKARNDK